MISCRPRLHISGSVQRVDDAGNDRTAEAGDEVIAGAGGADRAAGSVRAGSDVVESRRCAVEFVQNIDGSQTWSVVHRIGDRDQGGPLRSRSAGAADLNPSAETLIRS